METNEILSKAYEFVVVCMALGVAEETLNKVECEEWIKKLRKTFTT
jgi:hypothetical protein